jgi:hypothetical protein
VRDAFLTGYSWPEPILVTGAAAAARGQVEIPSVIAADVALAPWPTADRLLGVRAPGAAALVTALGRLTAPNGAGSLHEPRHRAVVVGTWTAALNEVHEFISEVEEVGANLVNPGIFPFTVINAAAGLAAIEHHCEGPNLTLNNGPTSALDAVADGADLIASGRSRIVFAGGFESIAERFSRPFGRPRGPLTVAALLSLSAPRDAAQADLRPAARLLAFCSAKDDGRGPEALRREVLEAATGFARERVGGGQGREVLPVLEGSEPETILLALLEAVHRVREGRGDRLIVVQAAATGQSSAAALVFGPAASLCP